MFENIPLPAAWPVYVSGEEAAAFARWRGRRLPTESEYHRAAFGASSASAGGRVERAYPWGDAAPDATRGNFDFASWEPVPAGARPLGASAWGVHDLVGNGWEWTSTVFGPFPGFEPMASYPEYSADFFDGQHYVIKGASPGDRARARPPQLPQLVQAELSVRVREVQDSSQLTAISCQPATVEFPSSES